MSTTETDSNTQRPGDDQLDQPNMSIAAELDVRRQSIPASPIDRPSTFDVG